MMLLKQPSLGRAGDVENDGAPCATCARSSAKSRGASDGSGRDVQRDEDQAPIWSPAIKAAIEDWYTAKRDNDAEGLKSAARDMINSTAAYYRAGGVPLFAHRPLPPQFVDAELGDVHALPQAHAVRVIDAFIDKFDNNTRPIVAQQVAGLLRSQLDRPANEVAAQQEPDRGPFDLLKEALAPGLARGAVQRAEEDRTADADHDQRVAGQDTYKEKIPSARLSYGSEPVRGDPPQPDPDAVLPEFANPPMARNDGKAVLIWDSYRTGGSFDTESQAVHAAYRRLRMRCRGHNECGGNIYKVGNKYFYDLYQGYDSYNHVWQFRPDTVAWFHNHPGFGGEDRDIGFAQQLRGPMDQDPVTMKKFRSMYGRPLPAYIEHNGIIYYYKDYLSDRRGVIVPQ